MINTNNNNTNRKKKNLNKLFACRQFEISYENFLKNWPTWGIKLSKLGICIQKKRKKCFDILLNVLIELINELMN